MKNHTIINGNLLQTNKKWNDLKIKQKEWIASSLREKYIKFSNLNKRLPNKLEKIQILDLVYSDIKEKDIWIPYKEVEKYFNSKINRYNTTLKDYI